jgi:hypothetical protein
MDAAMSEAQRQMLQANRIEICKFVLYVQRDPRTGELDLPSKYAWMDSLQHEQDFALVDIADIDSAKIPSWLDVTPLLVHRRRDGNFLYKGEYAVRFLEKLAKSSLVGVTGGGTAEVGRGTYLPSAKKDPRYETGSGRKGIADSSVDAFMRMREAQDKARQAKFSGSSAHRQAGAGEPPALPPIQDSKAPLDEATLYHMGRHPSQLEERKNDFARRQAAMYRQNPAKALQASGGY